MNPFSGRRLAAANWEIARVILEKCHVDMNVVMTQRAGHAYDMVNKEIYPGQYDGVATVSGDGLIHEVVNGLFRREDASLLLNKMTVGFIPGGSANGLVKSVLDFGGEEYGVENAAFVVGKGRSMRMDLTEIEGEYETQKIYSFLACAWAVIADCDLNSEVLRWMGPPRFTVWGLYRVLCMRRYRGTIQY